VEQQLTYEVERFVFGRESESLRRLQDDRQVQRAIELLSTARTSSELFRMAAAEGGVQRTP
jgi:hypothetical protein